MNQERVVQNLSQEHENERIENPNDNEVNEGFVTTIGEMIQSTPRNSRINLFGDVQEVDRFIAMGKILSRKLDEIERLAMEGLKTRAKMMLKDMEETWKKFSDFTFISTDEYYEVYKQVAGRYYRALEEIWYSNEQDNNRESIDVAPLELEPLKIPTFNGTYEDWPTFSNLFESLIIKNGSLSNIQRMQYLKSVLTNDAERAIANLHVTEENFKTAWTILCERFDNKQAIIAGQIDSMLQLERVDGSSAQELRKFYDQAKAHSIVLKDVPGEQLLLHIVKRKLDERSRMLYQQKIENNEIIENVESFCTFLHKRCRVLETIYGKEGEEDDDEDESAFDFHTAEAGEYVHD